MLRQELKRSVDELKTLQPGIERSAAVGVRKAVAESLGEIRTEAGAALSRPLQDIEQAAGHVRQNIREFSWLWVTFLVAGGMVLGLLLGYLPLRRDQSRLEEQMNRIEQSLAAQQRPAPASLPPVVSSPGAGTHQKSHGGKKAALKIESDQPSAMPPLPDSP